ncbi:MAG TPA: amidohydrolase [Algoriphagus sp.]|mgnify:CR=1 FL=1|jgi:aminobenzoyl-glutamate utilization protein B|uniref:amidohydrolase n=1 Tax=unclassified Algoriphagus TaxID=2641541 RepID=UPI000C54379A|nr:MULTISPECIES: amidohydrolase [unclassified Algoriphagus]MAL12776.1 amidohydrolase [Algoriphagus sp.]MAN88957.1 amidohydrolase [Algoriphagus sp.]HAD53544.1 amidohydrolase [Algoriphagus sp.]HAS56924.1 amidohydrolase [Algoriphagus sp.]HCD86459.1 amidohydrolase [Algoriphagus sp.]
MKSKLLIMSAALIFCSQITFAQKKYSQKQIDALKAEVSQLVQENHKMSQVMVDKIFSFAELGFHEVESSKYLTSILEENGFTIEKGVSGIPTAWFATWKNGEGPVIALGSDVDCIPKASQYPGVAYHKPMVEGAPGHGEGHNAGIPLNITAALAVKKIMEREKIGGTLILWPGIAEELVAAKAWYTRDGLFDNVDLCIFTHVGNNLGVSWGQSSGTGLISVEYTFSGEAAHSAGSPWRGRSALDAAELMNIGWNYKREHLHPLKRSHSIFTDGGDQPNVVPSKASIWYYFRDVTYEGIMEMYETANKMAEGAALMTETEVSSKILGTAWPRHFNKVIAEQMYQNILKVGLPEWSEEDQMLAKAVQEEVGSSRENGLPTKLDTLGLPVTQPVSGGSDDIGDVSWVVPTVTLRFPSNIPGLQGHHWSNAIAMATPIAHKGVTQGAKAEAMTILDFLLKPELVDQAWDYFKNVQTKETQYKPMIIADDAPPIYLNTDIMNRFKPELQKFYYDETKFDTYLEQLGVKYPTVKKD